MHHELALLWLLLNCNWLTRIKIPERVHTISACLIAIKYTIYLDLNCVRRIHASQFIGYSMCCYFTCVQ